MRGCVTALLLVACSAYAEVQPIDFNNDGTGDAFYDAASNTSWYFSDRLVMSQLDAREAAAALNVFGVAGWRLPRFISTGPCTTDPFTPWQPVCPIQLLDAPPPMNADRGWWDGDAEGNCLYGFTLTDQCGVVPTEWFAMRDGNAAHILAVPAIPEPSTYVLMLLGLALLYLPRGWRKWCCSSIT